MTIGLWVKLDATMPADQTYYVFKYGKSTNSVSNS